MIKQFTDAEYEQMADEVTKAISRAKTPVAKTTMESPATTCKAVHRALACDGRKVEELTPYEQMIAGAFKGMKMATVEEFEHTAKTGTLLPAIEVDE
jgi:hypothetical protein